MNSIWVLFEFWPFCTKLISTWNTANNLNVVQWCVFKPLCYILIWRKLNCFRRRSDQNLIIQQSLELNHLFLQPPSLPSFFPFYWTSALIHLFNWREKHSVSFDQEKSFKCKFSICPKLLRKKTASVHSNTSLSEDLMSERKILDRLYSQSLLDLWFTLLPCFFESV